jgi:hypothetical protein
MKNPAIIVSSMNTPSDDRYPRMCLESGLTCESCNRETASQLAQACKGLRGKAVGQLFIQIHPYPACSRMHAHFAASYREASSGELARKGVQRENVPDSARGTRRTVCAPEPPEAMAAGA